jgi:hypothetical protein
MNVIFSLARLRLTFIQASFLVACVFGVLSIWASLDVLFIALMVIAFVGGASLGKGAVILVPLTEVALMVRAELIAPHPVEVRTFLLGGVVITLALGGIALVGARTRHLLRRLSTGQHSDG